MILEFNKQENGWVSEFVVTADFNLHIEGVAEGNVRIYQRGSENGEYAYVRGGTPYPSFADVYDFDFSALVYPKFIKVVCATEPKSAKIITEGEITELKNQEKEITVEKNGKTTITPDDGFNALSKVVVETSVGSPTELSDVNFFDYDGTLLYAYTWDKFKAMNQLPPLPKQKGLICQEWNHTLEDILEQPTQHCCIGATYTTDDGSTRLYVDGAPFIDLPFYAITDVVIDWGDGSVETYLASSTTYIVEHKYSTKGKYVVSIYGDIKITSSGKVFHHFLTRMEIGPNLKQYGTTNGFFGNSGDECPVLKAAVFCKESGVTFAENGIGINYLSTIRVFCVYPRGLVHGRYVYGLAPNTVTSLYDMRMDCDVVYIPASTTGTIYNSSTSLSKPKLCIINGPVKCSYSITMGNADIYSVINTDCQIQEAKSLHLYGHLADAKIRYVNNTKLESIYHGPDSTDSITIDDSNYFIPSLHIRFKNIIYKATKTFTSYDKLICENLIYEPESDILDFTCSRDSRIKNIRVADHVKSIQIGLGGTLVENIILPPNVEYLGTEESGYTITESRLLEKVSIPDSVKVMGYRCILANGHLVVDKLPTSLEVMGYSAIDSIKGVKSPLKMPKTLMKIGSQILYHSGGVNYPLVCDFSEHMAVPTLEASNSFQSVKIFIVPDELYEEWKAATNWSNYSSKIKKASEVPAFYVQHIDGTLYTAEDWIDGKFNNELANGVAVLSQKANFVVAKNNIGDIKWSSDTSHTVDGILTTGDSSLALSDLNGSGNTSLMLGTDTGGAAYSCANFSFPNGQSGYLPAIGELNIVYSFMDGMNSLLDTIGGTKFTGRIWSSTQGGASLAWALRFNASPTFSADGKYNTNSVRPFTTLNIE